MNHQRLQVYQRLVHFAHTVPTHLRHIPRGHGYLVDQFQRALASTVLNLVEGNGRRSPKERARFFTIAAASAAECEAAIELFQAYGLLPNSTAQIWQSDLRLAEIQIRKLAHRQFPDPQPRPVPNS